MIGFLSLLLIGACGLAAWPALRRAAALSRGRGTGASALESEVPFDLRYMPEPPVLEAAPVQVLDGAETFRWLRELELGLNGLTREGRQEDPADSRIVTAALAALGDPATQRQYFPRRPNLLPELIRAVNDEGVPVRRLVGIVARDPTLVGNLLRVANSSFYRLTPQPIETIERAIVVLGSDGLRSVMAAALLQPIFLSAGADGMRRFPELVWEHAVRAAHAAIPYAALVERTNPFAAELLCLISGLAEIVLFRAVLEHCPPSHGRDGVDPRVIASLLDSQAARFAWHIGADWRLSQDMLAALAEQMAPSEPATALGRSLGFGRRAGALAVLHGGAVLNAGSVRASLPPAGLSPAHFESLLKRLLRPHEDPRVPAKAAAG